MCVCGWWICIRCHMEGWGPVPSDRDLTIGSARPPYARLPTTLDVCMDTSEPVALRLASPLWDEQSADDDWQVVLNEDLAAHGWLPTADVAALAAWSGAARSFGGAA